MNPIKIGNITLENNVALAPMAGVTDLPYRLLCKEFGAGYMVSEMISSRGIYYKDKKTNLLMDTTPKENPIAYQIFGNQPDIMAYAAQYIQSKGGKIIDINMGCPTPKIVNNGDGSALMRNEVLAGKIIESVAKSVSIPVTVKFRSGWDEKNINAKNFAKIMENSGAQAICIHARTREQFYNGDANLDVIKDVKDSVSIPVFGNGDILTHDDAKHMIDYTGCDGVMIGRGSYGNMFIFDQCIKALSGEKNIYIPSIFDKLNLARKHLKMIIDYKGERIGIKESRKHMGWYIKSAYKCSEFKNKINLTESFNEMISLLNEIEALEKDRIL